MCYSVLVSLDSQVRDASTVYYSKSNPQTASIDNATNITFKLKLKLNY